jgi:hypothetical protein
MVLFQKFVRRFDPSTKMAPTAELSLTKDPMVQQSLIEIGSVVSEEKIFFLNFIPPFSIFGMVAILVGSLDHQTKLWKGGNSHKNLLV